MPRTVNGGGDQLARGAVKVAFRPAETTKEKWDAAFDDFDPAKFRGDSNSASTGDASAQSQKAKRRTRKIAKGN